VMNSNAAEAPGSLERGDRGATVTTDIAGAEHKTRTGCQYIQISRTHVEPVLEEAEETSQECSSSWIATVQEVRYPDLDEEESCSSGDSHEIISGVELGDIELEGETGSVATPARFREIPQNWTTVLRLRFCLKV